MAVTTTGLPLRGLDCVSTASSEKPDRRRRRHITPEAGRALEILGHAIEYLTDENIRDAAHISAHDPHVQAVQILMALNREIYYACPVEPAITERVRALFRGSLP